MNRGITLTGVVTAFAVLALAGCDISGTGEQVDSAALEDRMETSIEAQGGDDYEYDVRCEATIEAGTDFECLGYPVGLDGAALDLHGRLDEDGDRK